jgi:hypothetical protein
MLTRQPGEAVRSLTESRRLLEEARQEIRENRERAQLRPAHTFSPLPGFFSRPAETRAIECILEGDPSFTVLFGASSVGKARAISVKYVRALTETWPADGIVARGALARRLPR